MNKVRAAECFRVSTNTITEWVKKGCPCEKRGRNGDQYNFDLPAMITWRVEQLVQQVMGPLLKSNNIGDAMRREAFAKAELRELELAEKQKTLINVDAASRIVAKGIMECRSHLLAFEAELPPLVLGLKTLPEIRTVISVAIRDALNRISRIKLAEDILEQHLESLESSSPAHDQRVGRSKAPAQPRKQRRGRSMENRPS